MTNFEKWRQSLEMQEVMKKLAASSLVCDFCPARHECAGTGTKCKDYFVVWANKEVEE